MKVTPEITKNTLEAMAMCCAFAEGCVRLVLEGEERAIEVTENISALAIHFDEIEKLWMTHIKHPLTQEQLLTLITSFAEAVQDEGPTACAIWSFAHISYHAYTELNPTHAPPPQN